MHYPGGAARPPSISPLKVCSQLGRLQSVPTARGTEKKNKGGSRGAARLDRSLRLNYFSYCDFFYDLFILFKENIGTIGISCGPVPSVASDVLYTTCQGEVRQLLLSVDE